MKTTFIAILGLAMMMYGLSLVRDKLQPTSLGLAAILVGLALISAAGLAIAAVGAI